ncbi:MAG: phospholipase D-like domain-containing protein [Persicimonas sp.]
MSSRVFAVAVAFGILAALGCADTNADSANPADAASPDGKDEVALTGGKADEMFGGCRADKVLDLVNDPAIGAADLEDEGLHSRAAGNIIEARNGADGQAGTDDDVLFETLVQIDDVYYVGPVAMEQLASMVDGLCLEAWTGETEVIFSPQPYEDSHLVRVAELIDEADTSVDIAMYSMSDSRIMDALERAEQRGIEVRMIFEPARDERDEGAGTTSAELEDIGVDVRYINKIMHHKYALIDGPREVLDESSDDAAAAPGILVTGSANWSHSAGTRYDENTVITAGNPELNMRFQREFNHLWAHSRDYDIGAGHDFFETDTVDESSIPDDPAVDAVFTSDNFRTYYSDRYGETFSVRRGLDTVADEIVRHIEGAQDSIWVASGHLRSRPISEALLAKAAQNPDMDIKVYLDGQEYVSEWAHDSEVDDRQDCLDEAGDSEARRQDCLDKSYHYSFDVDRADNIELRFKFYAYRWHYTYAEQMHHKYMIIDGDTVLSGSYNYSDNAEHNTMENLVVYTGEAASGLVADYESNFVEIWETGQGKYDDLMAEVQSGDSFPIVFDSMALSWQQVSDLKSAIYANCPDVNSYDFRRYPQSHTMCYLD